MSLASVHACGLCGVRAVGQRFVCHIAAVATTASKSGIDLEVLSDLRNSDVDLISQDLKA